MLIIDCPTVEIAKAMAQEHDQISRDNAGWNWIKITLQGEDLYPPFSPSQYILKHVDSPGFQSKIQPIFPMILNSDNASFQQTLDEIEAHENPVCLTNHRTHSCVYMNNRYEPGRLIISRDEYCRTGLNFLYYWRDSMDQLEELLRDLNQSGKKDNFRYRMRQIDGSLCEYVMDYSLREVFGLTVRQSISHEWKVVQQAISNP